MFRGRSLGRDIVHRSEGNPLIRLGDLDFMCSDIWSAGVASFQEDIILLVTIEHLEGRQSIHLARTDEKGSFRVEKEPFIEASRDPLPGSLHELHGVMDARVTFMEGIHYIVYVAKGEHGFRIGLATTTDFVHVERCGFISEPDTKAGVLFPEKINGKFARLERPREGNSIWISYSDDLVYWGGSELLLTPRGGWWDWSRVGAGPPPMRIPEGWLLIYYGVKETQSGPLFRLGAAILDGEDPAKLVGRSNIPILSPREDYERIGNLSNIVFATGAFIKNENEVNIVYSGADSCVCLGSTTIGEIVQTCARSKEEF